MASDVKTEARDYNYITRQQISGAIRRSGVPAARWSKGRVSYRNSAGYDLTLWADVRHGFLNISNLRPGARIARIRYLTDTHGEGDPNALDKIEQQLHADGWSLRRDGEDLWLTLPE
jgi:hypothetical protein